MEYIIKMNSDIENQTYEINTSNPIPTNWFYSIDTKNEFFYQANSDCLHKNCSMCNGTGVRKDGLGPCIHMLSCPCPICSPRC